ncbi:MAG: hypothetical protein AB7K52_00660 [Phycisphaerales bacterium]
MNSDRFSFERLVQIGGMLARRATDSEFLCEIGLDQPVGSADPRELPSLDELIQLLRAFRRRTDESKEVRLALAVAAVNWAYKRAPGEGFRESFSRALLLPHETYTDKLWEGELGRVIERALVTHGSLSGPGSGPYRYVSPILEQAGVTEAAIPAFAGLLHQLERRVHDYTDAASANPVVLDAVEATFGNDARLGRFLRSPGGLRFVRETAHLTTWVKGDEPWLPTAVGFPPGFLVRLLACLRDLRSGVELTRIPVRAQAGDPGGSRPEPNLRLDLSTGKLVLHFPSSDGAEYSISVPKRMNVTAGSLVLGRDLPATEVYAGKTSCRGYESEWLVPGWPPHPEGVALFDESGHRVSVEDVLSSTRGRLVNCVAPATVFDSLSSGFRSIRTAEVTTRREVALGDEQEAAHACVIDTGLKALRVKLAELASVALPTESDQTPAPHGSRDAPSPVPVGTASWAVFSGAVAAFADAAQFQLEGWDAQHAGRFAFVARCVDGRTVELEPRVLGGGRVGVRFRPDESLCAGTLHIEPKGRLRVSRHLPPAQRFVVARGLSVRAPDRLLTAGQAAAIDVLAPHGCQLEILTAGTRLVEKGLESDGDHDRAAFELSRGASRLRLEVPIFRAGLDFGGRGSVLVLDPESLAKPSEGDVAPLLLRGIPHSRVRLLVVDPTLTDPIVVGTFELGETGTNEVDSDALLQAVTDARIMGGRFVIDVGDYQAATQTWFLDSEWATSALVDGVPPTGLPPTISAALAAVESIRQRVDVPEASPQTEWPRTLRLRLASWLDLRHAFEQSEPKPFDSQHSGLARVIHEVRRCVLDVPNIEHATRLLGELTSADAAESLRADGFLLPRWHVVLSQLEAELRRRADGTGVLRAWTTGCRTGEVIEPRPPNSLLFVGRALAGKGSSSSVNWSTVLQSLQTPTLDLAPPWDEVRDALLILCLLRQGHVRKAALHLADVQVTWLAGVRVQLLSLKSLLGNEAWQPASTSVGFDLVSPRPDDALLANALAGGPSDWRAAAPCSWMHAWLGWRASVLGGPGVASREAMLQVGRAALTSLPSSLESERIAAELEADSPENWNAR